MLIKGAVIYESAEHIHIIKLFVEQSLSIRAAIGHIQLDGGKVSMNCLSRIRNDNPSVCVACHSRFFGGTYAQTTCCMQCRDIVRRYKAMGDPIPSGYKPDRDMPVPDTPLALAPAPAPAPGRVSQSADPLSAEAETDRPRRVKFGDEIYVEIIEQNVLHGKNAENLALWLNEYRGYNTTASHIKDVLRGDLSQCTECNADIYKSSNTTTCSQKCTNDLRKRNKDEMLEEQGMALRNYYEGQTVPFLQA